MRNNRHGISFWHKPQAVPGFDGYEYDLQYDLLTNDTGAGSEIAYDQHISDGIATDTTITWGGVQDFPAQLPSAYLDLGVGLAGNPQGFSKSPGLLSGPSYGSTYPTPADIVEFEGFATLKIEGEFADYTYNNCSLFHVALDGDFVIIFGFKMVLGGDASLQIYRSGSGWSSPPVDYELVSAVPKDVFNKIGIRVLKNGTGFDIHTLLNDVVVGTKNNSDALTALSGVGVGIGAHSLGDYNGSLITVQRNQFKLLAVVG